MSSLLTANHLSKFLIVRSGVAKLIPQNVQKHLNSNGIQNFAIVSEENGSVGVQRPEIFNGEVKIVSKIQMYRLSRQIFPDKLKDLQGYKYKVAIDFSSYGISSRNNRIIQRTSLLFKTIAKSQNASFKIISVEESEALVQQKFDFVIDSKFSLERHATPSVLYNRNTLCILLPKVNKFTARELIDPHKADFSIVICLIVTYVGLFITWRLYKGRGAVESPVVLIFKLVAAFNGQGVHFSRDNRLVLKILTQLLMLTAVFANIFCQWNIGTSLAYSKSELSLKDTYKVFADRDDSRMALDAIVEKVMMNYVTSYDYMKAKNRIVIFDEINFDFNSFDNQKMAVVGQCEFVKILVTQNQHFFAYSLPSILSSTQVVYGPQIPFFQKIGNLINYSFEAGLPDIWETMIKMLIFGQNFQKSEVEVEKNIFEILGFDKLMPLFYTLFRGIGIAFVVFILEIFYHGFIRNLSWQLVRRWTTSMASRSRQRQNANINWQNVGRIRRAWYFWRQRRNLRVQRVNVRSVNV